MVVLPSIRPGRAGLSIVSVAVAALAVGGCGKGSGSSAVDAGGDGAGEAALRFCPAIADEADGDAAATTEDGGDGGGHDLDEFGPHALVAKSASSLGRVNVYEVTSPRLLERLDIYLRVDLDQTRITIAVFEAASKTAAFQKISDLQMEAPIDGGPCLGWVSSGRLAIPLEAGRFYMAGFDPSQPLTPFVTSDSDTLPVDGAFGRLIGSKTTTSVSEPSIGWDKLTDKEYNRQRLVTSPRAGASSDGGDGGDGGGDASLDAPHG